MLVIYSTAVEWGFVVAGAVSNTDSEIDSARVSSPRPHRHQLFISPRKADVNLQSR